MDKMIDGTDDDNNLALFVRLFSKQIPTICSRLQEESEATLKKHPSINTFLANYRKYPIID
jgi:hypothetical protein